MSASCAFGSQSSRSPQARAPILSPSSSCLPTLSLYPFPPPNPTRFYFSRFVPLYFARPPSILDFLPFHPFLFHEIHAFFHLLLTPSRTCCSLFFFFFFKTRDDEICLPHSFLFYLLNFVFLVEFKFHLHHTRDREQELSLLVEQWISSMRRDSKC